MDLASVVALYFCFVRGTCSLLRWQILGTSHCAVRCLLYFPILHCYAFTFYSSNFDMYMSYGWGSTGENVTSERHTTWRQSDTWCDVRALHDVMSDMSHERHDFVTWLLHANAHPASHISQYDNSHPVWCFWILLEFHNTIARVRSRVICDMIIVL